jgi:hypothetical protein
MHKKLHDPGKESLVEAYRSKGSFAFLSLEGDIMLTGIVLLLFDKGPFVE